MKRTGKFQAALDNHANQLNSNNPAYWGSRGRGLPPAEHRGEAALPPPAPSAQAPTSGSNTTKPLTGEKP